MPHDETQDFLDLLIQNHTKRGSKRSVEEQTVQMENYLNASASKAIPFNPAVEKSLRHLMDRFAKPEGEEEASKERLKKGIW